MDGGQRVAGDIVKGATSLTAGAGDGSDGIQLSHDEAFGGHELTVAAT